MDSLLIVAVTFGAPFIGTLVLLYVPEYIHDYIQRRRVNARIDHLKGD